MSKASVKTLEKVQVKITGSASTGVLKYFLKSIDQSLHERLRQYLPQYNTDYVEIVRGGRSFQLKIEIEAQDFIESPFAALALENFFKEKLGATIDHWLLQGTFTLKVI